MENIKELLSGAVGGQLSSKFGFDASKTSGIMDTVSSFVSSKMDKGEMPDEDKVGAEIASELESKNGLSSDMASQVKDLIIPIITKTVKDMLAKKLTGGLGEGIGKALGNFKF